VIALMIVNRRECFGLHDIGVEPAVEMIQLVLQNPRIPAGRFDHPRLSAFVEACHSNGARPRYHCHQSRDAETALIEGNIRRCKQIYLWIDDCVEGDWHSLPFAQLFGGEAFLVFGLIFNHRDLKRFSNLRRGQAHSWSIPHGVSHVPNQILDLFAADFVRGYGTRNLAQNRIANFANLKNHRYEPSPR
jgi:hypothetical protein